jgi:hypothetical protein
MRILVLTACAALLTLPGCSKPAGIHGPVKSMALRKDAASAPAAADMANAPSPAVADAANEPAKIAISAPMLAYNYNYGVAAAPKGVRELKARHEAACIAAGLAACQVVSSNVTEEGADNVSAQLVVRAAPAWLKAFRDGLAGEAKSVGGRITKTAVESEDLSHQIIDTEAALRAKITLRDRLQAILQSRPGKVSDLLEAEREFARVQGEIDAAQSELAVMRTRVATAELTVDYKSEGVLAPQGVFAPLRSAVSDFLGLMVGAVAVMIEIVAVILPFVLVLGGLWWLLRKRLPKLRRGKPEANKPTKT